MKVVLSKSDLFVRHHVVGLVSQSQRMVRGRRFRVVVWST
jgi:hypothetical protein